MVFSISIGDALMLAKIAYTLGRAFTSGRNSAPAEFVEVQNLLYTLSESLKLLARDLPERPENGLLQNESKPNMAEDGDTILVHIVANCRSTLTYLEGFVAKYMELDSGNPVEASARIGERWKEEVRKNWKKLRWTTEGGGLEKLKTMLNTQINGLDLALSALNRHHGKIVHERVDTMYTQLDEIYQWFAANLKGCRAAYASETRETESSDGMSARSLNFVVYAQLPGSTQRVLLCPKGSLNDLQTLDDKDAGGRTILGCCCAPSTSLSNSAMRGNVRPHSWQLRFSLLPVSFLICSAEPHGHREYQIYAASPNSNVPMLVYITKLAPTDLARLENYANELAALQAAHHAKQGLSSMLLHPSRTNFGEESMSILAMKTDVSDLIDSLLSLRFVANGHHFTQGRVESFQLLHFKSLPTRYLRSTLHEAYTGITHQQYAELVLHCDPSSSNATRYFVQIEYDTPIKRGDNPQVANLGDVLCVAEGDHDGAESVQQIKCSTLELEFLSMSAAEEFVDRIKAMQRELFILYLQYPRLGEQVVYQRPIGDLMVRDFYLADAGMSVIRNPTTGMYRLVFLNKLHSVSVCFENIASGSLAAADSLAWFIQIGSESTSIVQQPAEVSFTLSTLGQTAPLFQQDQINEPGVKSPAVEEC